MTLSVQSEEYFMQQAYIEAQKAFEENEVPIGAVVVCEGKIIARAHNYTERLNDVTAHAEMQAITSAANFLGGKFLNECELYVTLEPCPMCAGAIGLARFKKLVFGAYDAKRGYTLFSETVLHPKTQVKTGILLKECSGILTQFFQQKRNLKH